MAIDVILRKLIELGYYDFAFINVGTKREPFKRWGFEARKGKTRIFSSGVTMELAVEHGLQQILEKQSKIKLVGGEYASKG